MWFKVCRNEKKLKQFPYTVSMIIILKVLLQSWTKYNETGQLILNLASASDHI